jgi:rhodanese-related sulfurtransferase
MLPSSSEIEFMFFGNIKEIEPAELARQLEQQSQALRVIDVRSINEIMAGTIPGAEPLPLHLLPVKMGDFRRDETLVFICRSGARSAQACAFLQQQGFENVINLRGGMIGWVQNGLPAALPQVA